MPIPHGLNHPAQGWPIPRGLPWVNAFESSNPERVEYQGLRNQIQPVQGCDSSMISPKVARSSQPWAASFNPVGIVKTIDDSPNTACHSTENSEKPKNKPKCLPMKYLHTKTSFANQAPLSPIKPNQGVFLNHRAHDSITPPLHHSSSVPVFRRPKPARPISVNFSSFQLDTTGGAWLACVPDALRRLALT